MRVLLLAPHEFYVDRGTPIDVDLLLRALSQRGETVDVVCYKGGSERTYPGVTLHRIDTPRWLRVRRPGFSAQKLFADLYVWRKARQLLAAHGYDAVHANEEAVFIAMWIQRKYGIPYIYDMDSSIAQQMVEKMPYLRPMSGLFNWCERKAVQRALAVAPVCNALRDLANSHGATFIETLHDISQYQQPDRKRRGILARQFGITGLILMYVGNLEPYQGVDLLLEAMPLAREQGTELSLVIAGGNDAAIAHYRRKAESLNIADCTHFIGRWPANRLCELLSEADILTAPRIRGLNTPMKIFPYLHAGKPLLVTDLPTHSQILDASIAYLAPPAPHGFANAIAHLARDPTLRWKLGKAGRAFVEANHTYSAHVLRVNRLYDYVTDQCERAAPLFT